MGSVPKGIKNFYLGFEHHFPSVITSTRHKKHGSQADASSPLGFLVISVVQFAMIRCEFIGFRIIIIMIIGEDNDDDNWRRVQDPFNPLTPLPQHPPLCHNIYFSKGLRHTDVVSQSAFRWCVFCQCFQSVRRFDALALGAKTAEGTAIYSRMKAGFPTAFPDPPSGSEEQPWLRFAHQGGGIRKGQPLR